jgi:hypothetical protein
MIYILIGLLIIDLIITFIFGCKLAFSIGKDIGKIL